MHGDKLAQLMIAEVKELVSNVEDMDAFRVASMGGHFNPEGDKIDFSSLMPWNAKVANKLFPLFYKTQREHDAYVQSRLKELVEMLNDSRTNWGTVATFDHFPLNYQMLATLETLLHSKLPGSQPLGVGSKSCAQRAGAVAIPLTGMPKIIVPIDAPFIFFITSVQDVVNLGGATLEHSYTKWLSTDDENWPNFFKQKFMSFYVDVGEMLYIPYEHFTQALLWEEPPRGKAEKRHTRKCASFLLMPVAMKDFDKDAISTAAVSAIKVHNEFAFEKKKGKEMWDVRAEYFNALLKDA
jgi:hypothetical protein